jgi:outer membrane protein assembly factor BamD (BamD/ComL family)
MSVFGVGRKVFARRAARRRRSALGLLAFFALGAAVAVGCGWGGTENSVRFNNWHGERHFSRLPPLPFDARTLTKPDYREEEDEEEGGGATEELHAAADAVWTDAETAARLGDFARLPERLGEYLKLVGPDAGDYYKSPVNWQSRRRSARDQLDALDALGRGGSARAVSAYLAARREYYGWLLLRDEPAKVVAANPSTNSAATPGAQGDESEREESEAEAAEEAATATAETVAAALDAVPRDAEVDDNVAYLRAALLLETGERAGAAEAFERLAARYPRSEKREAALLNAGLLRMKESGVGVGEVEHAASDEPCRECRGDAWRKAVATFERMQREHPRGRHAGDARGWLAFLHTRVGARAEGLVEYYRMLADERDAGARAEAVVSLRLVRDGATEDEMERVEALLAREPSVALAYVYHEIYNATFYYGFDIEIPEDANPYRHCKEGEGDSNCWSQFYDWQSEEGDRRERAAERQAIARVAAFATRLLRGAAGGAYGGTLALRVAQADLELGEDKAARELASRALSSGLAGNERASALWVRGAAEYRLKEFDAARRTFATLLAEFPEGDLTEGARRYAALAAEDSGDLDGALEQYLALEYTTDAAYFVDVLMTTEQLASFAERHADSPARDMLFYSLGVRLMREHRFAEARAAYARVSTSHEPTHAPSSYYPNECEKTYPPPHCTDAKNPRWQEWKGVRPAWVLRDLKTMDEVGRLEEGLARAAGDEAKAEALYQLGSYLYESSDLVFYNPAAWRGGRFYAFYYDQRFRAPGEAALMRRYMEAHEPLVRALRVYQQVVYEYPRTRAARDALYTAAVIHQRLGGFLYWSGQYRDHLYAGERLVGYEDVRRAYPDYALPAGTYGWEPSTRTVNGRAAWPAPPKPKQLTGAERARLRVRRAERRVALAWELYGEVYGGRVRAWTVKAAKWSVVGLAACAVLLAFRLTRRARRFLYRRLTRSLRRPARRPRETYARQSSYGAHSQYLWSEGPRSAAGRAAAGLFRLALHERGRAALALNLFTHGLLTVLLWAVLWAART